MTAALPIRDVVVLEDDALVRDVLTDIIEAEGFFVHPVATAADALARITASAGCSLLLADIELGPGPNGFEAARAAQERHPELPVIYLTAWPAHSNDRHFGPRERFLRKPFRTPELVEAIRSLAAAPPFPAAAKG